MDQWGVWDAGGWKTKTITDSGGRPDSVRIAAATGSVLLDCSDTRDRTLEIQAWAIPGPMTVGVSINGASLTSLDLSDSLSAFSIQVPSAFWQPGSNRLGLTPESSESKVFVATIDITPAETIETLDDGLQFAPHTSATWQLELAGPGLVDFKLESRSDGTASFQVHSLERLSGVSTLLEERQVKLEAGHPTIGRLLLPAPNQQVFEVSLTWDATRDSAPLQLSRLILVEDSPLERPPVLFISIDTLAAQSMSLYGYDRETTANLERFAMDSVLFTMMRSNAPWTVPSYASQFTGLNALANRRMPSDSKIKPMAWQLYSIGAERWTLSEMMHAAGYRTAAFVDNSLLSRVAGLRQGFEVFDTEPATRPLNDPQGGMRLILPRVLLYLDEDSPRPPFVFAQIFDVHGPYSPQPPFKGTFSDGLAAAEVKVMPVVRAQPVVWTGIPGSMTGARFKKKDMPKEFGAGYLQADYDEKVLELDSVLGDFFEDLKARGLYDELLIIFTADHGEAMVDHDFNFRHGLNYDSVIHVPFLIKLPHQEHAGAVVSDPVQLLDLYPTLAELIGLEGAKPGLQGRSLLPAIEGHALPDTPAMSQADVIEHCSLVLGKWKLLVGVPERTAWDTVLTHPVYQARTFELVPDLFVELFGSPPPVAPARIIEVMADLQKNDKDTAWRLKQLLIKSGPVIELYNMESDPLELENVATEHPDIVAALLESMQRERETAEALRLNEATTELHVTDEMLDELRRLGYLGDE